MITIEQIKEAYGDGYIDGLIDEEGFSFYLNDGMIEAGIKPFGNHERRLVIGGYKWRPIQLTIIQAENNVKYDFSKSCTCDFSPGKTWCCNNCGLPTPVKDRWIKIENQSDIPDTNNVHLDYHCNDNVWSRRLDGFESIILFDELIQSWDNYTHFHFIDKPKS